MSVERHVMFATSPRPAVSVLMTVFGRIDTAIEALQCLATNTDVPFEVVIIDNASPEGGGDVLAAAVSGATLIRNDENLGFGGGNNQAALAARGEVLCLLNSDALVGPGWLPPLLETLALPATGAVVPTFLNPDGTLQEAGSVLYADGLTRPIGGGADPNDPAYRFRRVVDYGSAACMVLRRSTFAALGGFDPCYHPAYYEDVEMALALRAAGLVVRYEPRSRITHLQGSGSNPQAHALSAAHRKVLRGRWGPALALQATQRVREIAPRDSNQSERLLIVDDRIPNIDHGSGDPRMARFLQTLSDGWPDLHVTFLARDSAGATEYAPIFLDWGIEVVWGVDDWSQWFRDRAGHYTATIISRPSNFHAAARLIDTTQPLAFRVIDAESLDSLRLERQLDVAPEIARDAIRSKLVDVRAAELAAFRWADAITSVSDDVSELARAIAPRTPGIVLGHSVEVAERVAEFSDRDGVAFFGGFMAGPGGPNEDAALVTAHELLPMIDALIEPPHLRILGADPTPAVVELASDRIEVLGRVADPRTWLDQAKVHIAPIRFGAGLKLRFVETMAAGLPFVTTSIGAEGLGLDDDLTCAGRLEHCHVSGDMELVHRDQVVRRHRLKERVLLRLTGRRRFSPRFKGDDSFCLGKLKDSGCPSIQFQ